MKVLYKGSFKIKCLDSLVNQLIDLSSSEKPSFSSYSSLALNFWLHIVFSLSWDRKGEDLNHCQGADSPRKKRRIDAVFCETRQKGGVRESVLHMENIAGEPMTQKVMTGSCKI